MNMYVYSLFIFRLQMITGTFTTIVVPNCLCLSLFAWFLWLSNALSVLCLTRQGSGSPADGESTNLFGSYLHNAMVFWLVDIAMLWNLFFSCAPIVSFLNIV